MATPDAEFLFRCKHWKVRPASQVFTVSVARQRAQLWKRAATGKSRYRLVREYVVSTSRFGIGQEEGSNRTPLGLHRIARKIGGGLPEGAVFVSRKHIGFMWDGHPDAAIAHRILWLEGLEPGLNRGGSVDTFRRYIYIHGVGDETTIGKPASRGCVHLAARDLIPLYRQLRVGSLVWIGEA